MSSALRSAPSRLWAIALSGLLVVFALYRCGPIQHPAGFTSEVDPTPPSRSALELGVKSGLPASEAVVPLPSAGGGGRQAVAEGDGGAPAQPTFRLEIFDLDGRALGEYEALVHLSADPEVIALMRRHVASRDIHEARASRSTLEGHPACLSSWSLGPFPRPSERASLCVTDSNGGASAWLDLELPIPEVVTMQLQVEHVLWVDVRDVLGTPVPKFYVRMALQDAEGEWDYAYGLGSGVTSSNGRATIGYRPSPAELRALAPTALGVTAYLPPNDHPFRVIPIDILERGEPVEWVLPEYGSVEISVDWPEAAGDEYLYFAIYDATDKEIDPTRYPRANGLLGSTTLMVPPGQPYTFEFVPAGRRLAATVERRGNGPGMTRQVYFDGPSFQGQRVRITPR